MSYNLNIAGFNYPLPSQSERNWSAQVNDFFTAVATKLLQKSGGSFTLTADVDFGSSNGALLAYIKSKTSTSIPATGWLRLDKADRLTFRNILNNADMPMGLSQSSGRFQVGVPTAFTALAATDVFTSSGRVPVVGETVQIQSFSGTGITLGATYYATTIVGDTFKLYTSLGGPTFVDVTLDGSGVFIVQDDIVTSGSVDTLQNKLARDFAYGSEVGTISGNSINTTSGKVIQRITSITGSAELWQINFPTDGKVYNFINETGAAFTVKNNLGAATRSIFTPAGLDFVVPSLGVVTFIYDTALTAWVVAGGGSGSSSGSGLKNYIVSPNGITGWVSNDITKITVALEAAAANLPDNATQTSGIKITRVSANDGYVRVRWNMDTVDYGVLGQFLIDAKTAAVAGGYELQLWSDPTSSYAASVQMSMSAFAFPTGTSKLNPWAQAGGSAAPYMEMRIVARTTAGVLPLYLNNATYTPGIVQQSSPIIDWTSYTPVSNLSNTSTIAGKWRRVGSDCEVTIAHTMTGNGTSVQIISYSLPTGLSINTSAIPYSSANWNDRGAVFFGVCEWYDLSATASKSMTVTPQAGTTTLINIIPTFNVNDSSVSGNSFDNGDKISMSFKVPIAEWAGQVMATGAGARIEYAYQGGTVDVDGASNGSGTVSSPLGLTMSTLGDQRNKYILWQTAPADGDLIGVQMSPDSGASWSETIYPWVSTGTSTTTQGARYINTTAGVSRFIIGRYTEQTNAWAGTNRVRFYKVSPTAPVGVLPAGIDGTAGYAQAGKIPGSVLGTAIGTGYIGEVRTFTNRTVTGAVGAWNVNATALDTLSPGVWFVCAYFITANSAATSYVEGAIATNALADGTGIISNASVVMSSITTAANNYSVTMRPVVYNTATSQALYAKSFSEDAAQNATVSGFAVRMA